MARAKGESGSQAREQRRTVTPGVSNPVKTRRRIVSLAGLGRQTEMWVVAEVVTEAGGLRVGAGAVLYGMSL